MALVETIIYATAAVSIAAIFASLWYIQRREASRDRLFQTQMVTERERLRYGFGSQQVPEAAPATDLQGLVSMLSDPTVQGVIKSFLNSNSSQKPPEQ